MNKVNFTKVADAAKFLDEKAQGWANKIDLKRLNMGSPCDCVLGQMYGSYPMGIYQLGVLGSECFGGHLSPASAIESTIQKEWIQEINARLTPKLSPLQQAEKNIVELEARLQEEKAKLESLRNPEISVTLSKSDWKIVVRTLQTVTFAGSPIAVIAETIDKQIGE